MPIDDQQDTDAMPGFSCPVGQENEELVTLAHGGGGKLTRDLVEGLLLPAFAQEGSDIARNLDAAVLPATRGRRVFTTDSYVVHPLVFPGGDIGKMAVSGTVNDLAMMGARPEFLSLGLIIEEGFPRRVLEQIIHSAAREARQARVEIVAGDTKVVEKGKCDGLFINTSGIGTIDKPVSISPAQISAGDLVVVSGDIGRHGVAILGARDDLGLALSLESDVASINHLVDALLAAGIEIHCMRDLTRGGLGTALLELAADSGCGILLDESLLPVSSQVRHACDLLGFDPVYMANEGRFVMFIPAGDKEAALKVLHSKPHGGEAAVVGEVTISNPGQVRVRTAYATERTLQPFTGEQLPRIC